MEDDESKIHIEETMRSIKKKIVNITESEIEINTWACGMWVISPREPLESYTSLVHLGYFATYTRFLPYQLWLSVYPHNHIVSAESSSSI